MTKFFKPRPAATLKAAAADLVLKAGGLERAADILGVSRSQVHRYTDPLEPQHHLKINQVRTLESTAGDPIVTNFLAAEAGCLLIRVRYDGSSDLNLNIAALGKEASDVFAAYGKAMADEKVTAKEAAEITAQLDDLAGAVAAMRSNLSGIKGE